MLLLLILFILIFLKTWGLNHIEFIYENLSLFSLASAYYFYNYINNNKKAEGMLDPFNA